MKRTIIAYNKDRNTYDVVDADGRMREMRRASEALPPPGSYKSKPNQAEDIRALREAVEGMTGQPLAADVDAALVAKLQRVRRRRAHGNKARVMLGQKPLKITEREAMARERTALGWVLAITGAAFALAIAAPGKHVNQDSAIALTPAATSRMVPALDAKESPHAQD